MVLRGVWEAVSQAGAGALVSCWEQAGEISKRGEMDELRGEPDNRIAVLPCAEFLTGAGCKRGRVKRSLVVARNCSRY